MCLICKSYCLQKLHSPLFCFFSLDSIDLQRKADIIQHAFLHEQIEMLKDHADITPHQSQLLTGKCHQVFSIHKHLAGGRLLQ